jgi:hypothetical protein
VICNLGQPQGPMVQLSISISLSTFFKYYFSLFFLIVFNSTVFFPSPSLDHQWKLEPSPNLGFFHLEDAQTPDEEPKSSPQKTDGVKSHQMNQEQPILYEITPTQRENPEHQTNPEHQPNSRENPNYPNQTTPSHPFSR